MDIFVTVLLLLAVLFAAYYTTKLLSVRAKGMTNSKNMQLLESMMLGRDRQIALIKVGQKVLVIGITAQSMEILTEISEDEIEITEFKAKAASRSFKDILTSAKGVLKKYKTPADTKPVTDNREQTLDSMLDDLENRIKKKRSDT
jgi:flagellar protein FliO/FliZ